MTNIILTGSQAAYLANIEDWIFTEGEQVEAAQIESEDWIFITNQTKEFDVEEGWRLEEFIIKNITDNKLYGFLLYSNVYEGWSVDNGNRIQLSDIIELYEVEAVPTVKYVRKELPKTNEDPTINSIPTPYNEVLAPNSEINN